MNPMSTPDCSNPLNLYLAKVFVYVQLTLCNEHFIRVLKTDHDAQLASLIIYFFSKFSLSVSDKVAANGEDIDDL